MLRRKNDIPTFNDGVARICEVRDSASDGDKPKQELHRKLTLRYEERTVGIKRFWTAQEHDAIITRLLRCPKETSVSTQDVLADHDGKQYKIIQIQYPEGMPIPVMDLSLERIEKAYVINQGDT